MIIKKSDNRDADVQELQRLLGYQISAKQRFLIEREIKCIDSGSRGENSSAYYIDFRYHDSQNWAVIHDLRLELNGFVAQIDHLLINRFLDAYVLESKNYYYGIKITPDGEFLAWNGKSYVGIESPVEQNKRHISLLEKVVAQRGLLPSRLGLTMPAAYHNYVLVAPNSRIDRPAAAKFDTSAIIKADSLVEAIGKRVDAMGVVSTLASMGKMVSSETLEAFARSLAFLHRPGKFDYASKFGVTVPEVQPTPKEQSANLNPPPASATEPVNEAKGKGTCEACGFEVENKVVYYCRMNKAKFGGKTLCQSCQKKPVPATADKPEIVDLVESAGGTCEGCGAIVDKKVAYYCRLNKNRFGGKVLCRTCQRI